MKIKNNARKGGLRNAMGAKFNLYFIHCPYSFEHFVNFRRKNSKVSLPSSSEIDVFKIAVLSHNPRHKKVSKKESSMSLSRFRKKRK